VDQANQDGTRDGARLWRAARTSSLLLGLGLMGVLAINLPSSPSANYDQQKIVPASGPWIKVGPDRSDAQRSPTAAPDDDITAPSEETKQKRSSRKPHSATQLAKGSRVTLPS
jgi:hypothetical protein